MNKNVLIVTIILILVVVVGYLVWVRSKFQQTITPESNTTEVVLPSIAPVLASPAASASATPSATPKTATGAGKTK